MKRSNLDEMQEQSLLKLEHTGCWLAFWMLLAAIFVQALASGTLEHILGELAVFFILCFYILIGCLRRGIWDRRLKADFKTNLLSSLIAGGIVGIFWVLVFLRNGWSLKWPQFLLAFLVGFLVTFTLTMGLMSLCAAIYKKKKKALETE